MKESVAVPGTLKETPKKGREERIADMGTEAADEGRESSWEQRRRR
jgi:hypothetical protein